VGFLRKTGVFWLVPSISTLKIDSYGRLIDFLSQISKLYYFYVLDLADFIMHHWFPISFFVLIQSHYCGWNMCIISSFVNNWQFRRINHNGSNNPVSVLPPSSCTCNSHIIKNERFLAYFYAHSQFLCSLASFRLSTLGVRYPKRIRSDRLLFDETFAQPCIIAVVNCPDIAPSVFYFLF